MHPMNALNRRSSAALIAIAVGAVGIAPAMAAAPAAAQAATSAAPVSEATVSVTYVEPEKFSEAREYGEQDRYNDADYLKSLKTYLIKRATKMLPPGDRLEVTVTDIKLAGGYEPWHGPNFRYVRFMKDVYPPRMDLTFKLVDSNGKVLREGSRKLKDLGYLYSGVAMPTNTDPLRYDKALIDRWLQRGPEKL